MIFLFHNIMEPNQTFLLYINIDHLYNFLFYLTEFENK